MKNKSLAWIKLIVIWLFLILVLGEVGVRLFVDLPLIFEDEKTLSYRYDERLGWFPLESSESIHETTNANKIRHNAHGFRDQEYVPNSGKKTVAVFGDSFVWGYGVEQNERFTDIMEAFLPKWDILNMGVSGYGTDQELLLLQDWFPTYQPDAVILVVHINDSIDIKTNCRDHYYKPYFEKVNDSLQLKGTPVPTCFQYQANAYPTLFKSHFIQAMFHLYNKATKPVENISQSEPLSRDLLLEFKAYLDSKNTPLILVYTYQNTDPKQLEFLEDNDFNYLHVPTKHKFKSHGFHWTPEGHQFVSSKILERLYISKIIQESDIEKYPDLK